MRIAAVLLAALGSLPAQAQTWRLVAPESVNVGDLVALRLTRDGAPQSGATIRVAAPAREIATVRVVSADLRAFPTADSDLKGTLYKGDSVLVTLNTAGEWCGVLTAWGAEGNVPCAALAIRAFGQPVGTSDPDALDTFEDNYFGRWDSMVAFVEELLNDFGIERALDDAVPAPWRYYIRVDTDALARDLATEYTVCEDGDGVYLFEP